MSEQKKSADDHIVRYATGGTDLSTVENKRTRWGDVWPLFSKARVGDTTLAQYRDLNTLLQGKAKSAPGFFIGCTFKGTHRKRDQIVSHQFITLDIDEGTPDILRGFRQNLFFPDYEYVVHTTRSHGGDKIKLHVILPLAKPVDADTWHAAARILASRIDPKMMAIDIVSYRPAQVMYFPSTNSDVKYLFKHNAGVIASAEGIFADYERDWRDIGSLPRSEREDRVGLTQLEAENPLEKKGIVGAWCRTHDIHDVIEMLDPPKYEVSERDVDGTPKRYTFLGGHGFNGAVVYHHDNIATKLHSHHGTDPVSGQVNSFDLMCIHQFGHLDDHHDEKKDDPREKKSYKAMIRMITDDDRFADVRKEVFESRYGIDEDKVADGFEAEDDPEDDGLGGAVAEPGDPLDTPEAPGAESTRRPPSPPPMTGRAPDGKDWQQRLSLTEKTMMVRKTLSNVILILRNSVATRGRLIFDEFSQAIILPYDLNAKGIGRVVADPSPSRSTLDDHHRAYLQHLLSAASGPGKDGWDLEIGAETLNTALTRVADGNSYHPLKTWLADLPTWDGVDRVDTLFIRTCGATDDIYTREVAHIFMLSLVTRILEPGCKFDCMVILQGTQGWRKSTFFKTIAPWRHLYAETTDDIFETEQKFVEKTLGHLIVEIGELAQFGKADIEHIKGCLARDVDNARLSFRRDNQPFPRICLLVGTTNQEQYLRDDSGNRRFWPIKVNRPIDIDWLEREHAQLWAEALHMYREARLVQPRDDLKLDLSDEAKEIADRITANKMVHDISDDDAARIIGWLETPVPKGMEGCGFTASAADGVTADDGLPVEMVLRQITCAQEVWERCARSSDGRQPYDERAQRRVGRAMRKIPGWTMHAHNGPSCGIYGKPKTYRKDTT